MDSVALGTLLAIEATEAEINRLYGWLGLIARPIKGQRFNLGTLRAMADAAMQGEPVPERGACLVCNQGRAEAEGLCSDCNTVAEEAEEIAGYEAD